MCVCDEINQAQAYAYKYTQCVYGLLFVRVLRTIFKKENIPNEEALQREG